MREDEQNQSTDNDYLDQVIQKQQRVDIELKSKRAPAAASMSRRRQPDAAPPASAVEYRITGWWFWKTVVVPPNAYVVHTRRGYDKPVHIGMGISFRFNPWSDSFLVIPSAMQTIVINANCICNERQGILVQGYVQWIIDDVETAYRRLDFSDSEDPMRIVNVQLREQAEAAIKDKVSTMGIDDVLSDKQEIIEELTLRLRAVAESREGGGGLGLKIVTVQIKEAVISSSRLWNNLQKPFRAGREKIARLAELEAHREIAAQELTNRQQTETAELETEATLAQLRSEKERERYDREQAESARRHKVEQEAEQHTIRETTVTETVRRNEALALALKEIELKTRQVEGEIIAEEPKLRLAEAEARVEHTQAELLAEIERLRHEAAAARKERDLELERIQRAIDNDLSDNHVRDNLIGRLHEIARELPTPAEHRSVSVNTGDGGPAESLVGLLSGLLQLADRTKADADQQ